MRRNTLRTIAKLLAVAAVGIASVCCTGEKPEESGMTCDRTLIDWCVETGMPTDPEKTAQVCDWPCYLQGCTCAEIAKFREDYAKRGQ